MEESIKFSQDQSLQLEVGKVQALVAGYPDGIRQDAEWLAAFVRERCSRNVTALAAHAKKLGYQHDETNYSKILRGKMFDVSGTPCIRVKTFQSMVQALRKEARLQDMAGKVPFIETTTWRAIQDYIDFKRSPDTVCKFGLIIGATGSQKTACGKHYQALNNHGLCVHMESPELPTIGRFITALGDAYGVSLFYNMERKRLRILECVNDRSTIIVDNIQRMYKEKFGWSQPVFNFLQGLQDDTGCTVIMICVPEFELTLRSGAEKGYFEQFEGRVGGAGEFLWLPEYPPAEDVLAIAEAFKLKDAEDHVDKLLKLASQRGRIRILFNVLQKAKRIAGNGALTMEHMRAAYGAKVWDEVMGR